MNFPINIAAWTAPGCDYPAFVSINITAPGEVMITVRSPQRPDGGCGHVTAATLSMPEFVEFLMEPMRAGAGNPAVDELFATVSVKS